MAHQTARLPTYRMYPFALYCAGVISRAFFVNFYLFRNEAYNRNNQPNWPLIYKIFMNGSVDFHHAPESYQAKVQPNCTFEKFYPPYFGNAKKRNSGTVQRNIFTGISYRPKCEPHSHFKKTLSLKGKSHR